MPSRYHNPIASSRMLDVTRLGVDLQSRCHDQPQTPCPASVVATLWQAILRCICTRMLAERVLLEWEWE